MYIGKWWDDSNIDLVKIGKKVYALYSWNGETYTQCWECLGEHYTEAGEEVFEIKPIYKQITEDEFEIIGYELVR